MMHDNRHMVFLYGELRLGFWKSYILDGATHLGVGRTCEPYALYLGTFPFVQDHERLYPIEGDVFRVDDKTLENLDRIKGHPYWYRRGLVRVETEGVLHDAWLYFGQDCFGEVLPSGDYLKHCGFKAEDSSDAPRGCGCGEV